MNQKAEGRKIAISYSSVVSVRQYGSIVENQNLEPGAHHRCSQPLTLPIKMSLWVDAGLFPAIIAASSLEKAPVVELVDAVDSKSTIGNDVGVQVPPGAPFGFFSAFSPRKRRALQKRQRGARDWPAKCQNHMSAYARDSRDRFPLTAHGPVRSEHRKVCGGLCVL